MRKLFQRYGWMFEVALANGLVFIHIVRILLLFKENAWYRNKFYFQRKKASKVTHFINDFTIIQSDYIF